MGYVSDAQRKAVHASKADGGKGAPTNFGMPIIGQNPFTQYQTQNKALNNAMMFTGGQNLGLQSMMAQQMQAEQNAAAQAQATAPTPTPVDNSMDASLVGGVGTAPVATTNNFNPTTVNSAEGIFGNEQARKIQPYKKPLINF